MSHRSSPRRRRRAGHVRDGHRECRAGSGARPARNRARRARAGAAAPATAAPPGWLPPSMACLAASTTRRPTGRRGPDSACQPGRVRRPRASPLPGHLPRPPGQRGGLRARPARAASKGRGLSFLSPSARRSTARRRVGRRGPAGKGPPVAERGAPIPARWAVPLRVGRWTSRPPTVAGLAGSIAAAGTDTLRRWRPQAVAARSDLSRWTGQVVAEGQPLEGDRRTL